MRNLLKMNVFKKIWCRVFQGAFRLALPILPYRDPILLKSIEDIAKVVKEKNKQHVFVVTDKGILSCGLVEPLVKSINDNNLKCTIYAEVLPNPTVENVESALEEYKKAKADAIVAIGGGSAIDAAKALGARIAHPNKSLKRMGGILRVYKTLPLFFAIPTTAGTGSETTLAAIITDTKNKHKYALMSFPLIPHYAVLDPNMTLSLPPHLTSTTGMDALTHAIEAFIGRSTTRQTRSLACEAVKLIFENIEKVYGNATDITSRRNMLEASFKAGLAFSKSYVGYVHAIAHSLGGKYNCPHGLANAVILPYVLEEYGECVYRKLALLAEAANLSNGEESIDVAAKKFIDAIKELNKKFNIPSKLDCIQLDDIDSLAVHAEKEANPLYPVPRLMTAKQLEEIYKRIAI